LIVAAVIETRAELVMLESAVGANVFLCRLTASDDTLADRIRYRGREFGDDLSKLVKRSAELSELLASRDVR
jgi:ribose 1,5-bisphosphokinase PhnN